MVRFAARATHLATGVLILLSQTSCTKGDTPRNAPLKPPARISKSPFGTLLSGQEVSQFTLTNTNGIELHVIDYGGIITSLRTPDRHGVTTSRDISPSLRILAPLSVATEIGSRRGASPLTEWRTLSP